MRNTTWTKLLIPLVAIAMIATTMLPALPAAATGDQVLREVAIRGPEFGVVDESYRYDAIVFPEHLDDVSFSWEATGDAVIDEEDDPGLNTDDDDDDDNNSVKIRWETPGTKVVTVTATSGNITVVDTQVVIIIARQPGDLLREVVIRGPDFGLVNRPYSYKALTWPEDLDDVSFSWEASGDAVISDDPDLNTDDDDDDSDDDVSIRWETPGTKVITVTATQSDTTIIDTKVVRIVGDTPPGGDLRKVVIRGPEHGLVNIPYTYVALPFPWRTSEPISYTWETDGGGVITYPPRLQTNDDDDDDDDRDDDDNRDDDDDGWRHRYDEWYHYGRRVQITWPVTGTKTVTITAISGQTVLSDTQTVVIKDFRPGERPTEVKLRGPERGLIGLPQVFAAQVKPINAPGPFLYTWEATGQEPVYKQSTIPLDLVAFTWNVTGTKTVSVTVTNGVGQSVTDVKTIDIRARPRPFPPIIYFDGFNTGRPGSIFILVGRYFAANVELRITVNGRVVATVVTDEDGKFFLLLLTARNAAPGFYRVGVDDDRSLAAADLQATTGYTLSEDEPLQDGSVDAAGDTADVPADIAAGANVVYLPSVRR